QPAVPLGQAPVGGEEMIHHRGRGGRREERNPNREKESRMHSLVPTLCVGTHSSDALRRRGSPGREAVPSGRGCERRGAAEDKRSHALRGNEGDFSFSLLVFSAPSAPSAVNPAVTPSPPCSARRPRPS